MTAAAQGPSGPDEVTLSPRAIRTQRYHRFRTLTTKRKFWRHGHLAEPHTQQSESLLVVLVDHHSIRLLEHGMQTQEG